MMGNKLIYNEYIENVIEITMVYANLAEKFHELRKMDTVSVKQKCVDLANKFAEEYPEVEHWGNKDYSICIREFAKREILLFAEISEKPFYFTFGSWPGYPYQDTYLVVYGKDLREAIEKYRSHYPDINVNTVNCASWYNQEQWDRSICKETWKYREPEEIIR